MCIGRLVVCTKSSKEISLEALTLKGLSVVLQLPERERLDYNWLDNMKTMPHIPPRSSVGEGRREGKGGKGEGVGGIEGEGGSGVMKRGSKGEIENEGSSKGEIGEGEREGGTGVMKRGSKGEIENEGSSKGEIGEGEREGGTGAMKRGSKGEIGNEGSSKGEGRKHRGRDDGEKREGGGGKECKR